MKGYNFYQMVESFENQLQDFNTEVLIELTIDDHTTTYGISAVSMQIDTDQNEISRQDGVKKKFIIKAKG